MRTILRGARAWLAAAGLGLAGLLLAPLLALPAAADGKPGDFDYYALVLSWSPTYCAGEGGNRDELQCSGKRPFAFVLHGLWPQYEKGWPESCRTRNRPWVPQSTIDGMLDIMPSPRLVIHEFKKHGTCSGLDAEGYFALARKLYQKVAIPPVYIQPRSEIDTTTGEVERQFLKANPTLKPDMISVACARRERLKEIRVCFSREGEFRSCGRNEDQSRLCRGDDVSLPPVRGGRSGGSSSNI